MSQLGRQVATVSISQHSVIHQGHPVADPLKGPEKVDHLERTQRG